MAAKNIVLYTVQNPRLYVKETMVPPWTCKQNRWVFIELARYLGWDYWSWSFTDMQDFASEWVDLDRAMEKNDLWTLSVPKEEIRWCALGAQCERKGAVRDWFSPTPEEIRTAGDVPLGLIRVPVIPSWITMQVSAKQGFQEAGIWSESSNKNK